MKIILQLLMLAFTINVGAQNLAPKGAIWYYYADNELGNPYLGETEQYVNLGDTVIESKNCIKIAQYQLLKNDTKRLKESYYYADSMGYVSIWLNNKFMPYFNFNANVGDSVEVLTLGLAGFKNEKAYLDSTYIKNGLKHFVLQSPINKNLVVERLFKTFFYGSIQISYDAYAHFPEGFTSLLCYNDSSISYSNTTQPCNYQYQHKIADSKSRYYFSKYRTHESVATPYFELKAELDSSATDASVFFKYFNQEGVNLADGTIKLKHDEVSHTTWAWYKNNWVLLYNFKAKQGDTITSTAVINPLYITNNAKNYQGITTYKYIIDSVWQKDNRLHQKTRSIPGQKWEMPGIVREDMGSSIALLGQPITNDTVGVNGYVRCFIGNASVYFNHSEVKLCNALYLSLNEKDLLNEIEVYPNPATTNFTIKLNNINKPVMASLVDLVGRTHLTQTITQTDNKISTQHITQGIYFLVLKYSGEQKIMKVVVE